MRPRLRAVQPNFIEYEGNPYILLRDPLSLTEDSLLVPQSLGPLLGLCDGTRDEDGLRAALELYTGISLSPEMLGEILSRLDEALLLDNERFAQAYAITLENFRSAPCRPSLLSGKGYPADLDELKKMLQSYLYPSLVNTPDCDIRGVISPHIDYQRGGPVYAQVWQKAAGSIEDIDLAIILGTNHMGAKNLFTLTRQNYATPFGILPTAVDIVDRLADAIGHELAFEDELHHCHEHSIELALVWLHHFLGDRNCELVPILCGSFEQFIHGDSDPFEDEELTEVITYLQAVTDTRNALVIAAADLAHMGPAFGDKHAIDAAHRSEIETADSRLIKAMCSTDAGGFFSQIWMEKDARRICGLAPIYLTLRILGGAEGETSGYMQCPADEMDTSLVSICGVTLS